MDLSQQTYRMNLPAGGGGVSEVLDLAARHDEPLDASANDQFVPRAMAEWEELLDGRDLPSASAISDRHSLLQGPASMLIDLAGETPTAQRLGNELERVHPALASLGETGALETQSFAGQIIECASQSASIREPIEFHIDGEAGDGSVERGIALPFSQDGETVDSVVCILDLQERNGATADDEAEILTMTQEAADEPQELLLEQEFEPVEMPNLSPDDDEGDTEPFLLISVEDRARLRGAETKTSSRSDFIPLPKPTTDLAIVSPPLGLSEYLSAARDLAEVATGSETRSRRALYRAIGCAYDFALATQDSPDDFAEMVDQAGLKMQDRAPMAPVVKLIFGADYDKTRLTEYAAALSHAKRVGVRRGTFGDYLLATPGGLKEIVKAEREWRRGATGKTQEPRQAPRESLARKLRKLPVQTIDDLPEDGDEFVLILARRDDRNGIGILGEIPQDIAMLERAARKLLEQQR